MKILFLKKYGYDSHKYYRDIVGWFESLYLTMHE